MITFKTVSKGTKVYHIHTFKSGYVIRTYTGKNDIRFADVRWEDTNAITSLITNYLRPM